MDKTHGKLETCKNCVNTLCGIILRRKNRSRGSHRGRQLKNKKDLLLKYLDFHDKSQKLNVLEVALNTEYDILALGVVPQ